MNIEHKLNELLNQKGVDFNTSSNKDLYYACLEICKQKLQETPVIQGKKKLYYISAEFLIGKLLSNNLINLNIYDEIKEVLHKNNRSLALVEECEPEPSLGNGGLGRLATCFLDSIATLGLAGDGIGLNYHLGLFKQVFENNLQVEYKNPWIENSSWLTKSNISFNIPFKNFMLKSTLYDIDVCGYNNGVNKLRLFDLDSVDESIVEQGINFDKALIDKNLTLFLYPDDSDTQGHLLRIYQQYFMVSNAAQLILQEVKEKGGFLHKLYDYATIQINDTHPTLVIPELIRLLIDAGIDFGEACNIVSKTCAYTNHTILAEALEKWPLSYLEEVVPHLVPIIKQLDSKIRNIYSDEAVQIIDKDNRVHMAHIDIHFSYSVNGVAAIHTNILKETELHSFYELYPNKFNNKTNGITFRRWLLHTNHELTNYLDNLISSDYKQDAIHLEKLLAYCDDSKVQNDIMDIKFKKKQQLCEFIKRTQNIDLDPNAVFCIQIKRLHEYKRQQMNVLYLIHEYLKIKSGKLPNRPIVCIFGAKAAPAYYMAKDIIHTILCLSQLINNDPEVSKHFKVVMIENYNVSKAEKLIPACDISEQISLASKEASGTGNMKFMLNGALTLGTADGANVEIHELVGDENIYTFGKDSDTIVTHYANQSYIAKDYYDQDDHLKTLVDFLISDTMLSIGNKDMLESLHNNLINKDWFMTLIDTKEYIQTKERMILDYEDQESWARKTIINIAKAGFFSSDRAIQEYNDDIWKLK